MFPFFGHGHLERDPPIYNFFGNPHFFDSGIALICFFVSPMKPENV